MQSVLTTTAVGDSLWHRMDARFKLVGVLVNLILLPWLMSIPMMLLALVVSLLFLMWARIPIRWWIARLLSVAGFLLLFVVVLPWTVGTADGYGGTSTRGITLAAGILCKGLCAAAWILFLTGTTTIEELLHAASQLGLPRPIMQVLIVTWHYVQVMYRTIEDFRVALRLRGFRNRTSLQTYQTMANVVGTLFVHGYDRTERLVHAMHLRGYQGAVVSLHAPQWRWIDIGMLLAIVGFNLAGSIFTNLAR